MSRYVHLDCPSLTLAQLRERLEAMGVNYETAGRRRIMLQGSLECAGEPVDVRCPPGVAGAVEDFGFVLDDGRLRLVCGDVDRQCVQAEIVEPLVQSAAEAEVQAMAERAGLEVDSVRTDPKGRRKLVIKQR